MRETKQTRSMGMGLLALGGVFLWNPVVGMLDPLPDLIGYLLLCIGMTRLADLSDELDDARRGFQAMLWVSMGQLLASALVNSFLKNTEMEMNRYEHPVWILLLSFVSLVFQWWFLLPAWKHTFTGLAGLASFSGGEAVLRERQGRTACQRMETLTRALVILLPLLSLLPELSILTSFEVDAENPTFTFDWYAYIDLFRTVASIAGGVLGLIWLIGYLRFFLGARSDRSWQETLLERYNREILPDLGYLIGRRMKLSFGFLQVGGFLGINLLLSNREILPDWGLAILFLLGILFLGDLFPRKLGCFVVGVLLFDVGIAEAFLRDRYAERFSLTDALYLPTAYEAYLPIRILGGCQAILTLLLVLLVALGLLQMTRAHLRVDYGEGGQALSERATQRLHASFLKKTVLVILSFALSAACKIAEIELMGRVAWFWMVQVAVSVVAAIVFSSLLLELKEAFFDRYPTNRRV